MSSSVKGQKNKMFAASVHGFGVYLFWCTALIQTGSNLTIEVLRRTLNKIEVSETRRRNNAVQVGIVPEPELIRGVGRRQT